MEICEVCGVPKTRTIYVCGKKFEMKQLCACEGEKLRREEHDFKHRNLVRQLTQQCFFPNDLSHKTFEKDDNANEELTLIAKKYVEEFEQHRKNGKGLLLFGECDVGKSYISACIANALIEKEISVRMTNFSHISSCIERWGSRKEYIDHLLTFQVLIIDDLNAERDTAYMSEIVYQIVDTWTNANKPIIVTTNLTKEQLLKPKRQSDSRIYTRLFEKCIPYEVKNKHRRIAECSEYTKEFMRGIKK